MFKLFKDLWDDGLGEFVAILAVIVVVVGGIFGTIWLIVSLVHHEPTLQERSAWITECSEVCNQSGCASDFNVTKRACSCRCDFKVEKPGK